MAAVAAPSRSRGLGSLIKSDGKRMRYYRGGWDVLPGPTESEKSGFVDKRTGSFDSTIALRTSMALG